MLKQILRLVAGASPSTSAFLGVAFLSTIVVLPAAAQAGWAIDGVPVSSSSTYSLAQAMPDSKGGTIILWNVWAYSFGSFVQDIDLLGMPRWVTNGVYACPSTMDGKMVTDGAGGAIVVGSLPSNGTGNSIYAQHVSAAGSPLWGAGGLPLTASQTQKAGPALASDGAGGAIVVWYEVHNAQQDLYAQHVTADGVPDWGAYGLPVCTNPSEQLNPVVLADGGGGAIVVWEDWRNHTVTDRNVDLFAQRLDGNGVSQWVTDGVPVCTASGDQTASAAIPTSGGGVIVVWQDNRHVLPDIYAQKVDAAGQPQWAANGLAVCSLPGYQQMPCIATDGSDGAIVAWSDSRSDTSDDIYAQHVAASGVARWARNGVPVCSDPAQQIRPTIAAGTRGSAFIAWEDTRNLEVSNTDIYAQQIDSSGASLRAIDGVPLTTAIDDQQNPAIAADGNGGAVTAWRSLTSGNIAAQRLTDLQLSFVREALPPRSRVVLWPNPMTTAGTISVTLRTFGRVAIEIVDLSGRCVRSLKENTALGAGEWQFRWDGRDAAGRSVGPGIFFAHVKIDGLSESRRFVVVR